MLGGTFWIAFLRNAMGAVLMLAVFLLLDRPRFAMQKTVICYFAFGLLAAGVFSFWYALNRDAYLRFSGLATLPVLGVFCCVMSGGGLYLALYKLSAGFYLLSVCVCLGVDLSRWGFGGSMWADLVIRFLLISVILAFIAKKIRREFFLNIDFLQDEMDVFSIVTLVVSVAIAALMAYWPDERTFSVLGTVRLFVILFMAGIIQYLIFHLYIHLGKEQRLEAQKQLMEMNELLLRRQLEMREKTAKYLSRYEQDTAVRTAGSFCKNKAVNGILLIYEEYARSRDIGMNTEIQMGDTTGIREMDLVILLANILENAISLCVDSGAAERYISMSVAFKSHKIVIQCQNTCGMEISEEGFGKKASKARGGSPMGIGDIVRSVSRYQGETDFRVANRVFYTRVLLNLPQAVGEKRKYG